MMRNRNKFIVLMAAVCSAAVCSLAGCSTTKYVPTETQTVVNYIDSVRYDVRDSVVLIPKEVYKDYASLLDTLRMETEYAKAEAFVDTTHNILNGKLETKKAVEYRERIVYRDRIEYRDSIQVKEIPVEVVKTVSKTPEIFWWILGYSVLLTLVVGLYFGFKLK